MDNFQQPIFEYNGLTNGLENKREIPISVDNSITQTGEIIAIYFSNLKNKLGVTETLQFIARMNLLAPLPEEHVIFTRAHYLQVA